MFCHLPLANFPSHSPFEDNKTKTKIPSEILPPFTLLQHQSLIQSQNNPKFVKKPYSGHYRRCVETWECHCCPSLVNTGSIFADKWLAVTTISFFIFCWCRVMMHCILSVLIYHVVFSLLFYSRESASLPALPSTAAWHLFIKELQACCVICHHELWCAI